MGMLLKIKEFVKKYNIIVKIFLMTLLMAGCYLTFAYNVESYCEDTTDRFDPLETYVLNEKDVLSQNFRIADSRLKAISLCLGTYGRVNEGTVVVQLMQAERELYTWRTDMTGLADNQYYRFDLPEKLPMTAGVVYTLRVWAEYPEKTADEDTDNHISIWLSKGGESTYIAQGMIQDRTLCYRFVTSAGDVAAKLKHVFAAVCIVILVAGLLILNLKSTSYRTILLYMGILICSILVLSFNLMPAVNKEVWFNTYSSDNTKTEIPAGETKEFDAAIGRCDLDYFTIFPEGENRADVHVSVYDAQGELYFEQDVTDEDIIVDNIIDQAAIKIQTAEGIKRGRYKVSIQNNGESPYYVNTWKDKDKVNHVNICAYKYTYLGIYIVLGVYMLLAVGALVLIRVCSKAAPKTETVFLPLAITLGIIYMILIPVWSTPDSEAHYMAVYRLSNRVLGYDTQEEWTWRVEDSEAHSRLWQTYGYNNPKMQSYVNLAENFTVFAGNTETVEMKQKENRMKFYSALNYIPQVIGMTAGRLMKLSYIVCAYLARLCILAFYIYGCWRAIRTTPIGKSLFAMIPLIPVALMSGSSFSYDPMVLVSTLNFIACVFGLYAHPEKKRYLVEAAVWAFVIGAVKGGGYLLLLPMAVLPLFKSKKKKGIRQTLIIMGSGAFSVLLFDKLLQIGQELFQFGTEVSDKMSASYAYLHPIRYLQLCVNSYLKEGSELLVNLMGTRLGWMEIVLPDMLVILQVAVICIYAFYEKDELRIGKKEKTICDVTCALVLLFTPMMLLSWTDKGASSIAGLQGRYFLPAFVLVLLSFTKHTLYIGETVEEAKCIAVQKKTIAWFAGLSALAVYYMLAMYMTR